MLADFLNYYNHERPHAALGSQPPISWSTGSDSRMTFDEPPQPFGTASQQLAFEDLM
ncbi:transposase [Streptomyces hygroscopicus subsp. hygroscopicus]|uniref:integrase core domain-containing protein n=1 Tax=Streptomyces hygroscopicus TaxID=1912 RepID=UPI001C65B3B0|nr:transposase [Streptomyces hygroscopicus subsp. hygroscopicus]